MNSENEINLWGNEFGMYASGNRRISIISQCLQNSNNINNILDIGCNKCLIGELNPNMDFYGGAWRMRV